MTVRFAALLVAGVGASAAVAAGLVVALLLRMGAVREGAPLWFVYPLAFLAGCTMAFVIGLVATYAARWPGFAPPRSAVQRSGD